MNLIPKALTLVCLLAALAPVLAASIETHQLAAYTAARLSPEPFASNWQKCGGAGVPDFMRDQPLGHENARIAGLLYTREALHYLRDGQLNKALLLASARTHYVTDGCAIPHAEIWNPRQQDDILRPGQPFTGPWSYMPARFQDYWLPYGERTPGGYFPLLISPPPVGADVWDALADSNLSGSIHAFFDRMHVGMWHKTGFPTDALDDTTGWSAYDREFYSRWRAECIALEVLDRDSVFDEEPGVRFVSEERFRAVMDEELRNMIAADVAYFRYLAVAASTEVRGDLGASLPSLDPLRLLATRSPRLYLAADAPWPLRRVAWLLAEELVRARYRFEGKYGRNYMQTLRVQGEALFAPLQVPEGEADQRLILAWGMSPEEVTALAASPLEGNVIDFGPGGAASGYALLRGEDLQSALHLVDYLLDLTWAPLNGRTPVEVMVNVFAREWPGTLLIDALRETPEEEVPGQRLFYQPPNLHQEDEVAWAGRVQALVRPNTEGDCNLSGPLPALWTLMLFDLPLPDGTQLDLSQL